MNKLKVIFRKCIQNSQKYGSNNEHMMSKLFFEIENKNYECTIRQPHGSSFSFNQDPIEVDIPNELNEKVNHEEFKNEAEKYYKSMIGENGSAIRIENPSSNIIMSNNILKRDYETEISKSSLSGGW